MDLTRKEKQAHKLIVDSIKKALGQLNGFYGQYCKDNNVTEIPLAVILEANRQFLKSFNHGVESKSEQV